MDFQDGIQIEELAGSKFGAGVDFAVSMRSGEISERDGLRRPLRHTEGA